MARRKTLSPEDLEDQLFGPLLEAGPDRLTFALAAQGASLAAATLVQRYGTREAMVEAILLRAWDRLDAATAAADAQAGPGPEGAIDLLLALNAPEAAESHATDGLLLLREDIRRPALRARGAAWGQVLADAVGRRLSPDPHEAARLGWQMLSVWQGAQIWWAFIRSQPAKLAIRQALEEWCRTAGLTLEGGPEEALQR